MTTIEDLYKYYEILTDAKDKAGEHEKEYLVILEAVKGGSSEKRLASQLITRFFKFFPHLAAKAINSQLDLCEDEEIAIRKQAIRDLPMLCKDSPENLARIADVLAQLLQTEDAAELHLVQTSLLTLIRSDVKGGLQGLFSQIESGDDAVREKAIKFLAAKFKVLSEDLITKPIEEFIIEQTKKVLRDVTGDEFMAFMSILSSLKTMGTVQGRQQLVEIVTEQASLSEPFEGNNVDCVDRILQCARQASPLFSRNVHSTKFVAYFCDQVLPSLDKVADDGGSIVPADKDAAATTTTTGAARAGSGVRLELLKLLSDMVTSCPDLDELPTRLEAIYTRLLDYMPLPPADADNGVTAGIAAEPKLQFSSVECLMYVFHQLARRHPEFLVADCNSERLKDFKLRLQYFARGVQVYMKQLRMALQGKVGDALKTEENKLKLTALKITANINQLVKDLLHIPPSYKAVVTPSWKPIANLPSTLAVSPSAGAGAKRPISAPTDSTAVAAKQVFKGTANASVAVKTHVERKMYAPPTGKYSGKAGSYGGGEEAVADVQAAPQNGAGRGSRRGRGMWRAKY